MKDKRQAEETVDDINQSMAFRALLRKAGLSSPILKTGPGNILEEENAGVGENFDLLAGAGDLKGLPLQQRSAAFWNYINQRSTRSGRAIERQVVSPAGREVKVLSDRKGEVRTMLMFGSNNYLGFANDPYVGQAVRNAIDYWGIGTGGPPAINGYTGLVNRLESRIAELKGAEDALIFSSGYAANLALGSALARPQDVVIFDALSHASFLDGRTMGKGQSRPFRHNDIEDLERKLNDKTARSGECFVSVEGVYSMEGDIASLAKIVELTHARRGVVLLDDAHGTGVLGRNGTGSAEHCGVHGSIDVTMGTFSKVFGVTGGFIAGSKELVRLLRFTARSYIFSAALPPTVLAAVLAGIDLIEREPERRDRLRANTQYLVKGLRDRGFEVNGETPIVSLKAPPDMDMDRGYSRFHNAGIFLSAIEYPVVPRGGQRYRISVMALHTESDLNCVLRAVDDVWADYELRRAQ